jgi:hypothetical protein
MAHDAAAREREEQLRKSLGLSHETAGDDLSREVETLAAQLNAVWSHCRVVFYPPMDDPRGNYPLEHTNAARKDMRAQIEHRLSEITKRATVEPTLECDHPRSELLARKGNQFEMRKCLECRKIFRVRLRSPQGECPTGDYEQVGETAAAESPSESPALSPEKASDE